MTTSTARSIVDRLGKGSKLIRGGNEGGPTPNDGVIDIAGNGKFVAIPAGTSHRVRTTNLPLEPSGEVRWVTRIGAHTDFLAGAFAQAYGPSSIRLHFQLHQDLMTFVLTDDGSTDAQFIAVALDNAHLAHWHEAAIDIENQRVRGRISTDVSFDRSAVAWEAWSAWTPAPSPIKAVDGTYSTYVYGMSSAIELYSAVLIDANDNVLADASGTDGGANLESPAGSGIKTRLVEDRNVANLDGTDDFWSTDLPAPADDEMAGIVVFERFEPADVVGTLVSSQSAAADGFRIYAQTAANGNAGKMFAIYRSPAQPVTIVTELDTYDDGEPFALVWRVGDIEGVRTLSLRTNREPWVRGALPMAKGDVTHAPWRIGSRAYTVTPGHPVGFTEFIPFDFAPSEADLDVAMAAALESAGMPV